MITRFQSIPVAVRYPSDSIIVCTCKNKLYGTRPFADGMFRSGRMGESGEVLWKLIRDRVPLVVNGIIMEIYVGWKNFYQKNFYQIYIFKV